MVGRSAHPCEFAERINIAKALSNAHIPCLVWGTDAIDFIRKPSRPKFTVYLHLLLADKNIQSGAEAIVTSVPDFRPFTGTRHWNYLTFCALEPPAFPHSICLEMARSRRGGVLQAVFLHPQSQFYFDIKDHTRSVPLKSFSEGTRLPTLAAFFDSLIEVHSDPPTGCDLRMLDILLKDWHRQLVPGGQSPVLQTGELKPRYIDIMESLKPENRPCFEVMVKEPYIYSKKSLATRQRRKEILHELGCVCFFLDGIMVRCSIPNTLL